MENSNARNTKIKEKDDSVIYQIQGPKSFLKVKMDWANIDKVHLSFVSHTGRANGCSPIAHVEGALRINGGDGALYFCEAILSGVMHKRRQKALNDAKAAGEKYPQAIFTYNGGSDAKGDRPVMWRQIALAPGSKMDYAISVTEAEGEKNNLGGYQKKQGAKATFITVGCTSQELVAMASAIKMHWAAYIANPAGYLEIHGRKIPGVTDNAPAAPKPAATSALPAPQAPAAPAASSVPDRVYVVYDSIGSAMEVAITSAKALETLQRQITDMRKNGNWVRRDNKDYEAAKENILNGNRGIFVVTLYRGDESAYLYVANCKAIK